MNLTLWPILLILCHVPLLLYIHLMPLVHNVFDRYIFPSGVENQAEYDFIVVGAGSAGSVVAGRLAEHGHQVLLIEAGGPANWFMTIPFICASFQKTPYDWQYTTVPQKHGEFRFLKDKKSTWPRGKGLGGSSLLNYMQYMRGHPKDYDEWSELGGEGWSYEDVLPYFKKSQRYHESDDFDETYHGADGPMGVRKLPAYSCKMSILMEKSLNDTLGLEKGDCNGKNQNVIWQSQFNQNSGRRADSYSCFAAPYVGKGLTVLTFAHATKLIMSDLTAKGVEVERFGKKLELFAKNEVIVSAGAIGSPQLLMLSGIGPEAHLKYKGLKTILNKPGVGSNLQDHIMIVIDGVAENSERLGFNPFQGANPLHYLTWFTSNPYNGPLGDASLGVGAHFHTPFDSKDPYKRPQIQLMSAPFFTFFDWGAMYAELLGYSDEHRALNAENMGKDGVTFLPKLLRPKSIGTVRLASNNYQDHPIIDPEYLKHPDDVKTLVEALKICKSALDSKHFKEANVEPLLSPLCKSHEPWSDEYFKCVVQNNVLTVYHPVGTCKMGSLIDPMAVVDSSLKVIGTKNLRVIDASIMPRIVGGNTNAATVMIGEKGVDMIINEYQIYDMEKKEPKDEL